MRAKREVPFLHRRELYPTVANERVGELEQRVDDGSHPETHLLRWSIATLRFRAGRASMRRAWRG